LEGNENAWPLEIKNLKIKGSMPMIIVAGKIAGSHKNVRSIYFLGGV
jgi:hypothetical protein